MTTIYEKLHAIGAVMDHHYSDLYVKGSEEVAALLKQEGVQASVFFNNDGSGIWYDIPFAYDPYWLNLPR